MALVTRRREEDAPLRALGAYLDDYAGFEEERAEQADIKKVRTAWEADRDALLNDVQRHLEVPDIDRCGVTAPSIPVENTLEGLRQRLAQSAPPKSQPNGGGNPLGNDTAPLSTDERSAISDHMRECWTKDAGALNTDKQRVLLTVTTDPSGVARRAVVAGNDAARLNDPRFRAFAERAIRALMDPRCADLPLPGNVLGKVNTLSFASVHNSVAT